jgi:hypothetical protein
MPLQPLDGAGQSSAVVHGIEQCAPWALKLKQSPVSHSSE